MTPERWERLKAAFHGALDRPASERHAWLDRTCGDDPTLLREAAALLQSHDTAAAFLEEPARIDPADLEGIPSGTRLGPYRVLPENGARSTGRGVVIQIRKGQPNFGTPLLPYPKWEERALIKK